MNSILIIEALNIPKDLMLSMIEVLDRMTIKPFSFKVTMPRFKARIVIRITFTTVGMFDFIPFKKLVVLLTCIYIDFLGQNEAIPP